MFSTLQPENAALPFSLYANLRMGGVCGCETERERERERKNGIKAIHKGNAAL